MRANLVLVIPHKRTNLEDIEMKENRLLNNIAKREIEKHKVENVKDLIIYITRTKIYFERHKIKSKRNK